MSSESPASILFSSDGYELAVQNNVALPSGVRSLVTAGVDGGNVVRPNLSDTSGRLVTVGAGTAGTPAGGVVSIQGVTSGTAITVAQSAAANLLATVTQGTAAANSGAWTIKITDGTNNPSILNAAPTTEYGLVVRNIPSGSQTVISGTAANFLAQVSQPTAASLNATVVQGTAANLLTQVSQPTAASLNATVVQGTAANLNATVVGSGNFTVVQSTASNLNAAVVGTGSAGSPASGVVTVQGITSGTAIPVTGTITATKATTSSVTNVTSSASSTTILALNANRLGGSIYNDSSSLLYVKLGATASTSSYTIKMYPQSYWEIPTNYTGVIDGIWGFANGFARVDELTP